MFVKVKDIETHQTLRVWIEKDATVANLQQALQNITSVEPKLQRLISGGHQLNDTSKALSDYSIDENSTVFFWPAPNLDQSIVVEIKALSKEANVGYKLRLSLKDPISLAKKLTEQRFPGLQASEWHLYYKGRQLRELSSTGEALTLFDYGVQDKEVLYFSNSLELNKEIVAKLTAEQREDLEAQVVEQMISDLAIQRPAKKLRRSGSFSGLKRGFFLTPKELEQKKKLAAQKQAAAQPKKPTVQTNRRACWHCNKKIPLTAIQCKCGFVFCSLHRLPEEHDCSFDYKKDNKLKLQKTLIPVIADKVSSL